MLLPVSFIIGVLSPQETEPKVSRIKGSYPLPYLLPRI
jgi:hypothetical protein